MNRMKMYRKQKKMTLRELSDITNLSIGYLCHLENGSRNNPSMYVLNRIADALNKSVEDIFFS